MTPPLLEVEGLTVSYRRAGTWGTAVSNVSLGIGRGEAYGLVGESGCGKTTLALALMRYLPRNGRIDAGAIRVEGEDLIRLQGEALRRWRGARLGMVYQDPAGALNPALRVGDQIAEVYRFHRGAGRREAVRRAADALVKVAMPDPDDLMRRYPHQLSGGQRQRVAIARAIILRPHLVLADEPTSSLDVSVQAQILNLFKSMKRELGLTYVFVSHNLGVIRYVSDRVAVMRLGRVIELGPSETIFTNPQHEYTKALLDAVPDPDLARRDQVAAEAVR